MLYTIISLEQDMAGKWYARVVTAVDSNDEPAETQFFKFDTQPTPEDVQAAVNQWLASQQQQEELTNAVTE